TTVFAKSRPCPAVPKKAAWNTKSPAKPPSRVRCPLKNCLNKRLPMATSSKDILKEKDREIALLHAIAAIVSARPDLDELLQKFADLIVEQFKTDAVLIYLFEEKKDELVLRGSHKAHPQQLGQVKLKLGEGITGWVAEKRKTVAISRHAWDDP